MQMAVYTTERTKVTILLHDCDVQVSLSDWWEESATRDDWKYITTEVGEQSVMICSTILTLVLSAIVLDLGWY